jgi:hypothetical protein
MEDLCINLQEVEFDEIIFFIADFLRCISLFNI